MSLNLILVCICTSEIEEFERYFIIMTKEKNSMCTRDVKMYDGVVRKKTLVILMAIKYVLRKFHWKPFRC